MAMRARQSQRRRQTLSRESIIEAAVELLDAAGESGLTVRALTERLATGSGAIYWHVGTRGELLDAATDTVIAAALATDPAQAPDTPQDEIRVVALGLFDAIAEHQWLATQLAIQLTRTPWEPVTLGIFESIGRQIRALGVPRGNWFTATSALVQYILGATIQNAQIGPNAPLVAPDVDRAEFLDAASIAWQELDPDKYPFMRAIADQMRQHNDREQFLAGIDLVLTGITNLHPPTGQAHIAE
ncbi:TetR/AcrR family transcriptional regulator [Sphaerisporangium aureirubrum]|uniref:TetR/AcrR family transcriptional regulator n=1 Tax=Sphaerisporangium aureirubrum TaxID=1544736 RepID=A0ABW1NIH6_9ACTN